MNKKGNNITWEDWEVTNLIRYWQSNLSAGEIAKLLPGKSRSAVLGKIRRLKISRHNEN